MGNLAYDGSALRTSRAARKSAVSKPFGLNPALNHAAEECLPNGGYSLPH
jgi:hypothetical protein